MQLTERDRDIIRLVHRHRFLRSPHIVALLGGSPQQVLRRLQRLYHHGYEMTWTQNIHRRSFGIHRFRVLTVTTNSERVQGMIEACQRLKQGRGLFLFTDAKTLREQSVIFSLRWLTVVEGKTTVLLN